jgi:hypothetical protein
MIKCCKCKEEGSKFTYIANPLTGKVIRICKYCHKEYINYCKNFFSDID